MFQWPINEHIVILKYARERCKSDRAFRVRPGSSLSLAKCFGPNSGLHKCFGLILNLHNFFITLRVTIFFSRATFVVLTAKTSVSKVIVIFLHLILFANTALGLLFSAWISLILVLRRQQRRGNWHAKAFRRKEQSLTPGVANLSSTRIDKKISC